MLKRIYKSLSVIGPGIMAIGYTIGTGSVTSMIVAGSQFGMQLLWVLVLSCLFSWVLIEAYGRYYLVTGETALYSFRRRLKYGGLIGVLVILSVVAGQWNALIGILGLSASAIFETLALFFPSLEGHAYWIVLLIAISIIGMMYFILL